MTLNLIKSFTDCQGYEGFHDLSLYNCSVDLPEVENTDGILLTPITVNIQNQQGNALKFKHRPRPEPGTFFKRKLVITSTNESLCKNKGIKLEMCIKKNDKHSKIQFKNSDQEFVDWIDVTSRTTIRKLTSRYVKNSQISFLASSSSEKLKFEIKIPDSEICSNPLYVSFKITPPKNSKESSIAINFDCNLELQEDGTIEKSIDCLGGICNDVIHEQITTKKIRI